MNSLVQVDSYSSEDTKKIDDAMSTVDKNFIARIEKKKENKELSEQGRSLKLIFRIQHPKTINIWKIR